MPGGHLSSTAVLLLLHQLRQMMCFTNATLVALVSGTFAMLLSLA
jgi:hypothetical protein